MCSDFLLATKLTSFEHSYLRMFNNVENLEINYSIPTYSLQLLLLKLAHISLCFKTGLITEVILNLP
jgi:hypothetical protein